MTNPPQEYVLLPARGSPRQVNASHIFRKTFRSAVVSLHLQLRGEKSFRAGLVLGCPAEHRNHRPKRGVWVNMGTGCWVELRDLCRVHETGIRQDRLPRSLEVYLTLGAGIDGCVCPCPPQVDEFTEFSLFTDCHAYSSTDVRSEGCLSNEAYFDTRLKQ